MRTIYISFIFLLLFGATITAQPKAEPTAGITASITTRNEAPVISERVGVAQDRTLALSLNDAIRMAVDGNNEIDLARDDVRVNEALLRSAQGVFDPVITSNTNFRRNSFRGTGSYNTFSADLGYQHALSKGGGTLSPYFSTSRDGVTGTSTGGSFEQNTSNLSSLGVNFIQPLFRNRKIDNNRRVIKVRKKILEQSDADFRLKTTEKIFQVQQAYWDLYFALSEQRNQIDNLNLSKENLRKINMQIEDGAEAPLARAEVETELANREIGVFEAERQLATAENKFKQLILRDMASPEWSLALIPTDRPNLTSVNTSLAAAVADAISFRPELIRLKRQQEISEIETQYFRDQMKPRIDLNTGVSLDGFAIGSQGSVSQVPLIDGNFSTVNADSFLLRQLNIIRNDPRLNLGDVTAIPLVQNGFTNSPIVGGTGRSFRNLFSPKAANFSVGVTISFPFRNKIAEAELARTTIEQKQVETRTRLQELQVYTEVRNALQNVESAGKKLGSARKARENAEIQLQGEKDLFDTARSSRFLLFQRENSLVNARTAEISAQIEYNKALAELQVATSTTLRENDVQVDINDK